MQVELSGALEECLERIGKGESIEDCLAEYSHLRHELEPLLSTALSISRAPKVSPSDEFRMLSRARLRVRLYEESIHAKASRLHRETGVMAKAWRTLARRFAGPRILAVPAMLALLLALGGSISLIVDLSFSSSPPSLASQCTLTVLSGSVEVQTPGSGTWQQASDGITLQAGVRVKTASGSHALLTFFEGSSIKLEPGTDVEIERLERVEADSADIVLKQWLGTTWSRVVRKLDPGARYEIQTPSAHALVRGTLFETEVDQTALTTVRTTEGLVSVSAQNEEVLLPAGQEARVEFGASPSKPQPIAPADSELVIAVGLPAVASVCDPTGSSTGYLPSGFAFNQITGAQSEPPSEGTQVITIPSPAAGDYSLALRCVADGTSQFSLAYWYKGESVFAHTDAHEMTAGSEWLIQFHLEMADGQLVRATVGDIEPLGDRAPEKIVRTEAVEASLVPIQPLDEPGQPAETTRDHALAVVSSAGGSVTEPGQGVFFYSTGAVIDLVAKPDQGCAFDRWTGNVADPYSPTTTIAINQAEVVKANFICQH